MNRILKFRQAIYDKDGKFLDWHYWGEINGKWVRPDTGFYENELPSNSYQFSGLLDTKGNDIYEGSIFNPPSPNIGNYVCTFENGSFTLYHKMGRWGLLSRAFDPDIQKHYQIEVIGSTEENPELVFEINKEYTR